MTEQAGGAGAVEAAEEVDPLRRRILDVAEAYRRSWQRNPGANTLKRRSA